MDEFLYAAPEWIVYALTLLLMVGAAECGALLGRRHLAHRNGEADRFFVSLTAPAMGLLALMIGFTFTMSLSRYDARREAIVGEANAIGTAALRGRMLPEPYASRVKPLFAEYARLRIVARDFRLASASAAGALRRSAQIQDELWRQAMGAANASPHVVPTGLFIQALNDMIDMGGRRLAAGRNTVPAIVFFMLAGIAVVALGLTAFGAAQVTEYHRLAMVVMAAMIGSVTMLVFDFDEPQAGIIVVSQQALLDVTGQIR